MYSFRPMPATRLISAAVKLGIWSYCFSSWKVGGRVHQPLPTYRLLCNPGQSRGQLMPEGPPACMGCPTFSAL